MDTVKKYFTANTLFYLLLTVAIMPIWLFDGFITCDGPCHVYNAKVLSEFWWGTSDYYQQFYEPLINTNPNWLSHFLLAVLLQLFSPTVADKLIISLCIVLFSTGFRYFIFALNDRQKGMATWGLILVWQLTMFMGFYNYMLSMGLFFYMAGYWLRYYMQLSWGRVVVITIASLLLYFSHLMGLFFLCLLLFIVFLQMVLRKEQGMWLFALKAFVSVLPSMVLSLIYISHNYARTGNEAKESLHRLWWDLKSVYSLQSLKGFEWQLADIFFVAVSIMLLVAVYRLVKGVQHKTWIMPLVFLLLLLVYYFLGYESLFGGSYIRPRIEMLIFTFAVLFAAAVQLPKVIYWLSTFVAAILVLWFFALRLPAYRQYSEVLQAFKKAGEQIEDKSVVLPLRFMYMPVDKDGEQLARKIALFSHIGETIAPEKQLIFLNNYEADTKYFPIVWKEEINPYSHLSIGDRWGHEAVPAKMDIVNYNENYTVVDYVVTWQFRDYMPGVDSVTKGVMEDIKQHYTLKYEDREFEIKVYEKKKEL